MKKVCNIIIIVLLLTAIIISTKIVEIRKKSQENEKNISNTITTIKETLGENKLEENDEIPFIKHEGYQVIGTIKIDKINIEYPILNANTEDAMKKSIIKFWGDKVNGIGNLTMAGHNNRDGTMFGNIARLETGDKIQILDLYNNLVEYKVFEKFVTSPDDVNVVNQIEEETKEITLITCTNGNKNRLVIKAREI